MGGGDVWRSVYVVGLPLVFGVLLFLSCVHSSEVGVGEKLKKRWPATRVVVVDCYICLFIGRSEREREREGERGQQHNAVLELPAPFSRGKSAANRFFESPPAVH